MGRASGFSGQRDFVHDADFILSVIGRFVMLRAVMAIRQEVELHRANRGYLIIEVLVSLAIVATASGAFLGIYFNTKRLHDHVAAKAGASLVLQSVMDDVRAARLPAALGDLDWKQQSPSLWVWPSEPTTNGVERGIYTWQLQTGEVPKPGSLFAVTAVVLWQNRQVPRTASLTTQVYLK
jgi:type II secretory pathway pseudopilin PulG